MCLKLFQRIEAEGILQNSSYEVTIILVFTPHKAITKREIYRSISCMNIDAKRLSKILAKFIQNNIRKIIPYN